MKIQRRVGQLVNFSNLGIETGVDYKTVQSWLSILQTSYILFLLPPFYKNFNERISKTPNLYFYDTGLLCYLLRINSSKELIRYPYRGAIFENFMINELIKNRLNQGMRSNLYFWRDQSGNEVNIIIDEGINLIPVEIKSGQTIQERYFKGIRYWNKLTQQEVGLIYYAGESDQHRSNGISVLNWRNVQTNA